MLSVLGTIDYQWSSICVLITASMSRRNLDIQITGWQRGQELQFFPMPSHTYAHHSLPNSIHGLCCLLQPELSTFPSPPPAPAPLRLQQEFNRLIAGAWSFGGQKCQGQLTKTTATTQSWRRSYKPSDQPPQCEAAGALASLIQFICNAL